MQPLYPLGVIHWDLGGIGGVSRCAEQRASDQTDEILPSQLFICIGEFACQKNGQLYRTISIQQISLVLPGYKSDLGFQRLPESHTGPFPHNSINDTGCSSRRHYLHFPTSYWVSSWYSCHPRFSCQTLLSECTIMHIIGGLSLISSDPSWVMGIQSPNTDLFLRTA